MECLKLPGITWVTEVFPLEDNSPLGAQISNIGFHINAKNSFFATTVKKKETQIKNPCLNCFDQESNPEVLIFEAY